MTDARKLLDAWIPPEDAGAARACLATSFTFEPSFFEGDCLSRFLSLDTARNEGNDLAFLIEQEDRLAEVRAAVIVDRSYQAEGRSLRWDILTATTRGGVQHAKVTILLWERALRLIVGSANLTSAGYRRQVEVGMVLDAAADSVVPASVFIDTIAAVESILNQTEGQASETGPKQRALETVADARAHLSTLLSSRRPRARLRVAVASSDRPGSILNQFMSVWTGPPPRYASVSSPFHDTDVQHNRPTARLIGKLARRGAISLKFVVPVDLVDGSAIVRAPRSVRNHASDRVEISFLAFRQPDQGETRRLHAKTILLESNEWVAALVGSSNFTSLGLGLVGVGNLEVNIALGAPQDSVEARALRALISAGDPLEPDDGTWEPLDDDAEEPNSPVLPLGFAECLLQPGDPLTIRIRFRPEQLPAQWTIRVSASDGKLLVDRKQWVAAKRPTEITVPIRTTAPPLLLHVRWRAPEGTAEASWPLNVSDPAGLPTPEQLRDIPTASLIDALGSMSPLHEALAVALERDQKGVFSDELDPLRRHSSSGFLFQRTRRFSSALEGIRRRLERPAANPDVLRWRLHGLFGPGALAEGLLRDEGEKKSIAGEAAFFIAELALTVARVNWEQAAELLPAGVVRGEANRTLRQLRKLAREASSGDPELGAYVRRALRSARV
jgi:hypothetical protein